MCVRPNGMNVISKTRHLFPCQLPHKCVRYVVCSERRLNRKSYEKKKTWKSTALRFRCQINVGVSLYVFAYGQVVFSVRFSSGLSSSLSTTKIDYNRQLLNYSTFNGETVLLHSTSQWLLRVDSFMILTTLLRWIQHSEAHTMACLFECACVLHVEWLEAVNWVICRMASK